VNNLACCNYFFTSSSLMMDAYKTQCYAMVTPKTIEFRAQPLTWVHSLRLLKQLPYKLQSIVVVVGTTFHYVLPRMPSSPT
jgi:hypothetical protein